MRTIIAAVILAVSVAQTAVAAPVQYSNWSGDFKPKFFPNDLNEDFTEFVLDFDLSGLVVTLDQMTGEANLSGDFMGNILDPNDSIIGTSTASLNLDFFGLDTPPATQPPGRNIVAVGVEGSSTSAGSLAFALNFNNAPLEAENIDVFGGFLNPSPTNGQFGFLAGTAFNFLLQQVGSELVIDVWVKSSKDQPFTISNDPFRITGDIHGKTEIPEPGSMLLLGSGLLGVMARRRRKLSQ